MQRHRLTQWQLLYCRRQVQSKAPFKKCHTFFTSLRSISAVQGEAVRQCYKTGTSLHPLSTGDVLTRIYRLAMPQGKIGFIVSNDFVSI